MSDTVGIPWDRYALIADLSQRLVGISPQFGKTALIKLVFLLQEVYGVDCGYDFELHSYGPFTSTLLNDLDLARGLGAVSVDQVGYGYQIKPAAQTDAVRDRATAFMTKPRTTHALDSLIGLYGKLSARDLELRATIVFVERDMRRKGESATSEALRTCVGELKPKFSAEEIMRAIVELDKREHIRMAS